MVEVALQWFVVFCAIAIGWGLGVWQGRHKGRTLGAVNRASLEEKMKLFLSSYSDESLEKFTQSLVIKKDTLALHLSVASHFRKKGEVDRSLQIHQHLLADPAIADELIEEVTYELAKDYMAAGLLDRAESLLVKLQQSKHFCNKALRKLLEIYTQEKEWQSALEIANKLSQNKESMQDQRAHFYCELAAQSINRGDLFDAGRLYRAALDSDRNSIRAYIEYADLLIKQEGHKEAVVLLRRAVEVAPDFMCELMSRLLLCAQVLDEDAKLQKYIEGLKDKDNAYVFIGMADSIRRSLGDREAEAYLTRAVMSYPDLLVLDRWIDLRLELANNPFDKDFLKAIKQVTVPLLVASPRFCCKGCGFSGMRLHWLCPSCKQWGLVRPQRRINRI